MLALARGASVSGALATVEPTSPDLALVLVVLQTCADQGGAPAEPIDRAATALRQRAALAAERHTQSAPARMSAVVMTSLPGAMLAVLLATSAAVRAVVVTPIGLLVLAAGTVLNIAGWCWMRHLVSSGPT